MKYPINFNELRQSLAVEQAKLFDKSKFWWVYKKENEENQFIFNAKTKELYSLEGNLPLNFEAIFSKHQFWWIFEKNNLSTEMLFDANTDLIWFIAEKDYVVGKESAKSLIDECGNRTYQWRLPRFDELKNFVSSNENPWRSSKSNYRLFSKATWLCEGGRVDLDYLSNGTGGNGYVIATANKESFTQILENFSLKSIDGKHFVKFKINTEWKNKSFEQIILDINKKQWLLESFDDECEITSMNLREVFDEIDYRSVRLPKLEDAQFTDINKGMWEFWGADDKALKAEGVVARDPMRDVKKSSVAIDFGTSSTVIAIDNNGRQELLRIGVRDFYEAAKPIHYENPTVLEFVNYPEFLTDWQKEAYRPETKWDDVRFSHEAQYNFRNNQTDSNIVSSIFPKMKQWALRKQDDVKIKIIDQISRYEFELEPLELKNPIKGQLLTVSDKDNFDPIELYAWFLGMTINWRSRGIFVKYYMTFPVAYPKEVKEKILASFRRGLQRSMPQTLVLQDAFHKLFEVKEIASEPAAYAASALKTLGIQPTAEGVAYGVFDFGGGTTDFDYGFYRKATLEEEDLDGTEKVLEHIAAQGDKFLGGENLLENLAFRVFNHNLDLCRKEKIAFTCPLDATPLPGTELLLDKTQAAQTNMIMLMAKLRPFWETGKSANNSGAGIEKIDLLNRDGQKVSCELKIPTKELNDYLNERITKGILHFFTGMKEAFGQELPKQIHIFLAGNSSRSIWVKSFFDNIKNDEQLKSMTEKFIVHPPLEADEKNLYRPTAKTGVALGLLELCDGGAVALVNRNQTTDDNEASFNHFVGRIRQDKFSVTLKRGQAYEQWHELGPVGKGGVTFLYHTQSPQALSGEMEKGDTELLPIRLDFAGDIFGHRVFVRAIEPNTIEVCSAESFSAIEQDDYENLQTYTL